MASAFLNKLPRELRDEIYFIVFNTTVITFKTNKHTFGFPAQCVSPNTLALLRTCHQIYAETKDVWIPRVEFFFKGQKSILDVLFPRPIEQLSKIRRLTTTNSEAADPPPEPYTNILHPMTPLFYDDMPYMNTTHLKRGFGLALALKCLPGLQLDELVVLVDPGSGYDRSAEKTLTDLIAHSNGWKVLWFQTNSVESLRYIGMRGGKSGYGLGEQPGEWVRALMRRDGDDAWRNLVTMEPANGPPTAEHTNPWRDGRMMRALFDSEGDPDPFKDPFHGPPLTFPFYVASRPQMSRELVIHVRRADNKDVVEKGPRPHDHEVVRTWADSMDWNSVRRLFDKIATETRRYYDCFGGDDSDQDEGE